MKYFISCINQTRQLGVIQIEAKSIDEMKQKAEGICPERAEFSSYELEGWEGGLPVGEFIPESTMKKLGY